MTNSIGSLKGWWRTRDGHFVELMEVNGGEWKGDLLDAKGVFVGNVFYDGPNHVRDSGLDLMIKKRGDKVGTEDFKWPI